uniref:Uncharacterized protein n=1 Tax=viral metagenome TaxID=1070528 RepID=A0A6H1ZHU1_9ZZZZ
MPNKTTIINKFDGGMLADLRDDSELNPRGFAITKHFNLKKGKTLEPYRDLEADEDKTFNIVKFLFAADGAATTFNLWGLGVDVGTAKPGIYKKTNTGDVIGSAWTAPSNNVGTLGDRHKGAFFHYKNYLYCWQNGTVLSRFGDITGTPTFTDTYQTISYTNVAQPVRHPSDDIAYFFQDNVVHKLNNTTWSSSALTLPSNLVIMDAEPYGDYLAIACKSLNKAGRSVVFLWDRDSSLATLSRRIDWGFGELRWIATLGGNLIGISELFTDTGYFGADFQEIQIRQAVGNKAEFLRSIPVSLGRSETASNKVADNDKLYFPSGYTIRGVAHRGIWSVDYRGNPTLEVSVQDAASGPDGIGKLGNYWFVAHSNDGSVDRTNNSALYTYTSIYESNVFNGGDSTQKKKVAGVSVSTEPLPAAGQIVLKYLINEDIAGQDWTTDGVTVFTNTTDDSIHQSAINNAAGVNLPEYKEIQWRIESTGGAKPTALKFKWEIIGKDIYE